MRTTARTVPGEMLFRSSLRRTDIKNRQARKGRTRRYPWRKGTASNQNVVQDAKGMGKKTDLSRLRGCTRETN
ncbi:MAG: hypothetical protein A2010_10125 [Nitrospirae bacterium GWD2_57_9]|nr:MAG: hypothetical protein A2010_10125 [Nitrospirae bacterium GWD2_57_9]